MPKITFIAADDETIEVDAENGLSLMEVAVDNAVAGIDADCGGSCACATCHVVIPESLAKFVGKPEEEEESLLEFLDNREENSRLSCQIEVSDELDGATITVPAP